MSAVSALLKVVGTVEIEEMARKVYLAKLVSQEFLLNEQQMPVGKKCQLCGVFHTLDYFYTDRYKLFNKTSTCKGCRTMRNKEFRENNPEYYRQYWMHSKDRLTQNNREWREANPDKLAITVVRNHKKRRQAMQRCLPDDPEYLKEMAEVTECIITGETVNTELDHVMPISVGTWGNNKGNLIRLSKQFNLSKGNKNVFYWIDSMEQIRLDYLLPEGTTMAVHKFQQVMYHELTLKAAEIGLSLEEYREKYNEDYFKEEEAA